MSLPISKGSAAGKNQERLPMAVLHIIMDKSHATPENSHSLPAAAERSPAPGDDVVDALRAALWVTPFCGTQKDNSF
jgi:hypothetical protein